MDGRGNDRGSVHAVRRRFLLFLYRLKGLRLGAMCTPPPHRTRLIHYYHSTQIFLGLILSLTSLSKKPLVSLFRQTKPIISHYWITDLGQLGVPWILEKRAQAGLHIVNRLGHIRCPSRFTYRTKQVYAVVQARHRAHSVVQDTTAARLVSTPAAYKTL